MIFLDMAAIDTRIFAWMATTIGLVLRPVYCVLQLIYLPCKMLIVPLVLILLAFSALWLPCLGVISVCAAGARKSMILRPVMFVIALPFVFVGSVLIALAPMPNEKSLEDKELKLHYLLKYPTFAFDLNMPPSREDKGYDVFISYRRQGGRDFARILQQALERRGYRCFFDYDSLRDGEFNSEIYASIHEAPNFILVLSEGALDRCSDPDDWVLAELNEGIAYGRKVIPVVPTGQPRNIDAARLPESIRSIANLQIAPLDMEDFFDESIDKIIESRFVKQKKRRW